MATNAPNNNPVDQLAAAAESLLAQANDLATQFEQAATGALTTAQKDAVTTAHAAIEDLRKTLDAPLKLLKRA